MKVMIESRNILTQATRFRNSEKPKYHKLNYYENRNSKVNKFLEWELEFPASNVNYSKMFNDRIHDQSNIQKMNVFILSDYLAT